MKLVGVASCASALVFLVVAGSHSGQAQTPGAVTQSDVYSISISMDKETVTPSHGPVVALAVKNISSKTTNNDDCSSAPKVWVQGEHGEPPTTQRERFFTMRLQPGEPELACTLNMSWSLAPGETRTKKILLDALYDLHQPGKFWVYVEFPTGESRLRSNTISFDVRAEKPASDQRTPAP